VFEPVQSPLWINCVDLAMSTIGPLTVQRQNCCLAVDIVAPSPRDADHHSEAVRIAGEITIKGKKAPRGAKMTKGNRRRLAATKGHTRVFSGALIETINIGTKRMAIFGALK
jgi:hypothetical protein